MRRLDLVIAAISIASPLTARAGDEIPRLPDADYFRSTPVVSSAPALPLTSESPRRPAADPWRHPLLEKSSLFGGAARRSPADVVPLEDSLFARKPLSPGERRSLVFRPGRNVELFPTLPATSGVRSIPLPSRPSASPPAAPRLLPADQPVILQSDFQEFPPLK